MLKPLLLASLLSLASLLGPGWLGVTLSESDDGRPTVNEVVPGSPAAKAGVKPGDVLVAVADTTVDSVEDLMAAVAGKESGTKIKLQIEREGKALALDVVLGERPAELALPGGRVVRVVPPTKGDKVEITDKVKEEAKAKVEKEKAEKEKADKSDAEKAAKKEAPVKTGQAPDVKPAGRPFLGISLEEADGGVDVVDVLADSPAQKAGLPKGRLVSIGGQKVANLADVDRVMGTLSAGQSVRLTVRGGKETQSVDVRLGAAPGTVARAGRAGGERAEEAAAQAKKAADADRAAREIAEKAAADAKKTAEAAKAAAAKEVARAKEAVKATRVEAAEAAPAKAADGERADARTQLRAVKGKQPALLVFGATWDSSTKALKKSFADERVQSALGGRKVIWIDTDQHGAVADEYHVQQIPHMVLLDAAGKQTGVIEGFQPAEMLADKLAQAKAEPVARVARVAAPVPAPAPATAAAPKPAAKPADRDLHEEIRALREEIRELRGLVQELVRSRSGGGR